jgi:hypothetical protein
MFISSKESLTKNIFLLNLSRMKRVRAMEKPETIIILWFVAFATILFILTLKFQNYDLNIRAITAALLTTPFAIWALNNIAKVNQLQTEKYLSLKWDEEDLKTMRDN